jgi:hypothetical protein
METKSWRPPQFAKRHNVSRAFIYNEIAAGRLGARKPTPGTTIITDEDEVVWLAAMPKVKAAKAEAEAPGPEVA